MHESCSTKAVKEAFTLSRYAGSFMKERILEPHLELNTDGQYHIGRYRWGSTSSPEHAIKGIGVKKYRASV